MSNTIIRRSSTLFFCFCFILSALLASLFFCEHASHTCIGPACATCAKLRPYIDLLKLCMGALLVALGLIATSGTRSGLLLAEQILWKSTPLSLHVRMNN